MSFHAWTFEDPFINCKYKLCCIVSTYLISINCYRLHNNLMDSGIGKALQEISTSNQWSVLDAVLKKVQKRMTSNDGIKYINRKQLIEFLSGTSDSELESFGIWYQGLETNIIVCVNPAFGRARQAELRNEGSCNTTTCLCPGQSKMNVSDRATKYFNSHDYNGGRHASTQSKHVGRCPLWRPAPSGHLHSWRRKYSEAEKSLCMIYRFDKIIFKLTSNGP